MMCLEVGPGTNRSYRFSPSATVGCEEVVFLDIEEPEPSLKRFGEWVVADAEMLPFRSGAFDKIWSSHVIEHLENPALYLYNIYRVLRRGGSAVIKTPNFLSLNAYRDPSHKHVFSFLSLRRLARRAGFKVHAPSCAAGTLLPKPVVKLLTLFTALVKDEVEVVLRRV